MSNSLYNSILDIHPWVGTDHCLREDDGCINDHTGCLWNDGNNGCMHPHKTAISPLLTKEKKITKTS